MAKGFKRKGTRYVARLDDGEREVVAGLMEQTREVLAPVPHESSGDAFEDLVATIGVSTPPPGDRDPALERLLPPAHREDAEIAAEHRRLTEQGLRERKSSTLQTAIEALREVEGERVSLDQDQAQALVVALTDVRLLLGERLGLRTDEDADALADQLDAAMAAYGFDEAGGLGADGEDPAGSGPRSEKAQSGPTFDPRLQLAAYYDFLTWLQESLAQSLLPRR